MALGKRRRKQTSFWVETSQLQARGRRPFHRRLNEILDRAKLDAYVERICRKYYAPAMGRPSIAPGVYFRCFLMGYFEGIDSERGIAYRVSDSLRTRERIESGKAVLRSLETMSSLSDGGHGSGILVCSAPVLGRQRR
jgi:transposase